MAEQFKARNGAVLDLPAGSSSDKIAHICSTLGYYTILSIASRHKRSSSFIDDLISEGRISLDGAETYRGSLLLPKAYIDGLSMDVFNGRRVKAHVPKGYLNLRMISEQSGVPLDSVRLYVKWDIINKTVDRVRDRISGAIFFDEYVVEVVRDIYATRSANDKVTTWVIEKLVHSIAGLKKLRRHTGDPAPTPVADCWEVIFVNDLSGYTALPATYPKGVYRAPASATAAAPITTAVAEDKSASKQPIDVVIDRLITCGCSPVPVKPKYEGPAPEIRFSEIDACIQARTAANERLIEATHKVHQYELEIELSDAALRAAYDKLGSYLLGGTKTVAAT